MGAFLTWTPGAGPQQSLFFDVVTEETQTLTSTATEHPVEDGANIADHVKRELDQVTLEVFVSNQPIYDLNKRGGKVARIDLKVPTFKAPFAPTPGAVFSAVGDAIGGLLAGNVATPSPNVLQWDSEFDAVGETQALLEKLRKEVQLVDVVTSVRLYENMFLEKIEVSRNAGTGDGAKISLSFKEIRKVAVSIVNAPIPTEARGATPKPKGSQSPKDAKAQGPKKSIAKALLDNLPASAKDFFTGLSK